MARQTEGVPSHNETNLVELVRTIYHNRLLMVLIAAFIVLFAVALFLLYPPGYEVTTVLEIPRDTRKLPENPLSEKTLQPIQSFQSVRGAIIRAYAVVTRPDIKSLPRSDRIEVESPLGSKDGGAQIFVFSIRVSVQREDVDEGIKWLTEINRLVTSFWEQFTRSRVLALKASIVRLGETRQQMRKVVERVSAATGSKQSETAQIETNRQLGTLAELISEIDLKIREAQLELGVIEGTKFIIREPSVEEIYFLKTYLTIAAGIMLAGLFAVMGAFIREFWVVNRADITGSDRGK